MANQTAWTNVKKKLYPPLEKDLTVDVCVVGGGLTGIVACYLLARQGKSVAVLEQNEIGSDATAQTTAFITYSLDTDLIDLTSMFGRDNARLIWMSHKDAINQIADIVSQESIDCEFTRCSNIIFARTEKEFGGFKKEFDLASGLGFEAELKQDHNLGFGQAGYLEVLNQAKFHPLKYLYRLAERAELLGAKIFEKSKVNSVESDGTIITRTDKATVRSTDVIIATYDPFNQPKETRLKKGMYNSYVFEVEISKGQIREATYEDTDNPYHYFRVDKGDNYDRMLVGGEDHRAEIKMSEDKNFKALEQFLRDIAGNRYKIVKRWVGPILEPSDGIALIGRYRDHQYVAAAFSGNGMTYAHIAGQLICDEITNHANPYVRIYDPTRVPKLRSLVKKGKDYTGELLGGAVKNLFK